MSDSSSDDFDPYRKWLGIPKQKRTPDHYLLLGISLDEDDHEVIKAAAEQRRRFVESKRGEGHDKAVSSILYQISEAETTLLNPELRRDYDRRMKLFEKRRKKRQVDPNATRSKVKTLPGRVVGEGSGLTREFAGIVAVLTLAFFGMAVASFYLPWGKLLKDEKQKADADDKPHNTLETELLDAVRPDPPRDFLPAAASTPQEVPVGFVRSFSVDTHPVLAVAFSTDGETIYSGDDAKRVIAWSSRNGEQLWRKDGFSDVIVALSSSTDGKTLFVCDHQNVYFVNVTGRINRTVRLPIRAARVSFGADARQILLVPMEQSGEFPAVLFDPYSERTIREFSRRAGVSSGAISEDGRFVVCGEYGLDVHDLHGNLSHSGRIKQRGYFGGLAISADDTLLATGSGKLWWENKNQLGNRLVRVWNLQTGEEIAQHDEHQSWVTAVAISPDGRRVLSGGGGTPEFYYGRGSQCDRSVRCWDLDERRIVWAGDKHSASITDLQFSHDGQFAISGGHDGVVCLWKLPNPSKPSQKTNQELAITNISSADSREAALASDRDAQIDQETASPQRQAIPNPETTENGSSITSVQPNSQLERPPDGYVSLFDGKTLNGWRLYSGGPITSGWIAENGMLCRKGNGQDIVTERQFGDFELEFEWRVSRGGNSGVLYRVRTNQPRPFETGLEYSILDNFNHPQGFNPQVCSGSIYGIAGSNPQAMRQLGEFNHSRIIARGNHVEHWLNGQKVSEIEAGSPDWNEAIKNSKFERRDRIYKARLGHICLQDHGSDICFRNIRIREL